MVDVLKSKNDEDQRKREEAQLYSQQQQIDELRRQLKENLARQQWFEELYRQGEGKIAQLQAAQDRLVHDVAQTLHVRQIDEGRIKAQIADILERIESPDKQIRELRSQIQELTNTLKNDHDTDDTDRQMMEDFQRQLREMNSAIALAGESQRQLRDLIHELDAALAEGRQQTAHVAELQRIEEQRLRRDGAELQGLFESLRQQFADVAARSQRVDDVRRQLIERIEETEERLSRVATGEESHGTELERIERLATEHYLSQQERVETLRVQIEAQFSEMRQVADQRMDRFMSRFTAADERLRSMEQFLSELPSRFEALERSDERIGTEADTIEEWLVLRQLTAMEGILEEVRKRRTERGGVLGTSSKPDKTPGSVYNPAGLLKNVKDAKPPAKSDTDEEEDS